VARFQAAVRAMALAQPLHGGQLLLLPPDLPLTSSQSQPRLLLLRLSALFEDLVTVQSAVLTFKVEVIGEAERRHDPSIEVPSSSSSSSSSSSATPSEATRAVLRTALLKNDDPLISRCRSSLSALTSWSTGNMGGDLTPEFPPAALVSSLSDATREWSAHRRAALVHDHAVFLPWVASTFHDRASSSAVLTFLVFGGSLPLREVASVARWTLRHLSDGVGSAGGSLVGGAGGASTTLGASGQNRWKAALASGLGGFERAAELLRYGLDPSSGGLDARAAPPLVAAYAERERRKGGSAGPPAAVAEGGSGDESPPFEDALRGPGHGVQAHDFTFIVGEGDGDGAGEDLTAALGTGGGEGEEEEGGPESGVGVGRPTRVIPAGQAPLAARTRFAFTRTASHSRRLRAQLAGGGAPLPDAEGGAVGWPRSPLLRAVAGPPPGPLPTPSAEAAAASAAAGAPSVGVGHSPARPAAFRLRVLRGLGAADPTTQGTPAPAPVQPATRGLRPLLPLPRLLLPGARRGSPLVGGGTTLRRGRSAAAASPDAGSPPRSPEYPAPHDGETARGAAIAAAAAGLPVAASGWLPAASAAEPPPPGKWRGGTAEAPWGGGATLPQGPAAVVARQETRGRVVEEEEEDNADGMGGVQAPPAEAVPLLGGGGGGGGGGNIAHPHLPASTEPLVPPRRPHKRRFSSLLAGALASAAAAACCCGAGEETLERVGGRGTAESPLELRFRRRRGGAFAGWLRGEKQAPGENPAELQARAEREAAMVAAAAGGAPPSGGQPPQQPDSLPTTPPPTPPPPPPPPSPFRESPEVVGLRRRNKELSDRLSRAKAGGESEVAPAEAAAGGGGEAVGWGSRGRRKRMAAPDVLAVRGRQETRAAGVGMG
jgi:hypothetical protein